MTPEKQERWLNEHVPHRVRACLAGIPFLGELLQSKDTAEQQQIELRCFNNAAWEGRMAGMRWLIEFIGVVDSKGVPTRPKRPGVDVGIASIPGGRDFDLTLPEAIILSKVWKGCSQASGHPTQDSDHPSVDEAALDEAMRIVVAHLQDTIYSKAARKLVDEALRPH